MKAEIISRNVGGDVFILRIFSRWSYPALPLCHGSFIVLATDKRIRQTRNYTHEHDKTTIQQFVTRQ